ncbi:hypothetical protein Y1Q_0005896 [Alligator mississippiensis]|uniref:Uncharacterized protein n=2 Tax=Alligator mississippiensis TaxID=8496 RepID=A0A151M7D7_ALLMI|nr:hypothetical protein Y1Q_0005896 [Alligator mississippiensis]
MTYKSMREANVQYLNVNLDFMRKAAVSHLNQNSERKQGAVPSRKSQNNQCMIVDAISHVNQNSKRRPTELNCKFMNKAGISYVSLNHEWMSRDNVIAKSQNNKCTREAAISSVKWNKVR